MSECVFCKIVKGEIPCHKVYEDESVLAFLDIHPLYPGHSLAMPKQHVDEWQDLDEQLFNQVMIVARLLAKTIKQQLKPPRVGLWVEGFEVPHAHVHISPLQSGDDFKTKRTAVQMRAEPDHAALAAMADKLK